jgi:hypothetical protein
MLVVQALQDYALVQPDHCCVSQKHQRCLLLLCRHCMELMDSVAGKLEVEEDSDQFVISRRR